MPSQMIGQDQFTRGELSPYMYARTSVDQYYYGLKTAHNVLCYPQGAAGKRFGTLYRATIAGITNKNQVFFETFQYLNECNYQLVFYPDTIKIYLEGTLNATVTSTGFDITDIQGIDSTTLDRAFRVTTQSHEPKDLKRVASTANVILSQATNIFTLTTAITNGLIIPVRFTNASGLASELPITVPQVKFNITYFVKQISTTQVKVYQTSKNAFDDVNQIALTNVGIGVNNIVPLNTWSFTNVTYKTKPGYDFTGGYDTYTFTPSAVSGASVTITSSTAVFYPEHVGGAFIGGGGIGRIVTVAAGSPSTTCTVAVEQPYDSTAAIAGRLCLLTEPAWSTTRGYPLKCSSFQNRAIFANTESLPNGIWCSSINDYSDWNDLQSDDDDAIAWFPTSDDINYIRFIVPYRSVTVHTNSGVYSTPLSFETAITPKNFSLQLQDSTPADKIKPRSIDNQIIVISGNDVHTLLWDGINNAYTSDIISILSEQVIRTPIDETVYVDKHRAGSRYVFIINDDGTMAIFQTLISQDVKGWTPNSLAQSYGDAFFNYGASSVDGRCWFLTEREIATQQTGINITAFTSTLLTSVAINLDPDIPTAVTFTTTGSLPISVPQIALTTYYWAIGVGADTFKLYLSQADALANENAIVFTSAGTTSKTVKWTLVSNFFIEELSFEAHLDCAEYVTSTTPFSSVASLPRFNAQDVKMVGDGFGFSAQGVNDTVDFIAHGEAVEVTKAYIGFKITTTIEPLPLSISTAQSARSSNIGRPKHIRNALFMFNNTIGGTINGVPIALKTFGQIDIGLAPTHSNGIFEYSVMKGWNDFNQPTFTIVHDDPFNIELLGIFYQVDF